MGLVIIFFLIVCFVSVIFIIRVLYSTPFLPPFLSSLPWFFVVFFFFFLFYLQVSLAELRPAAVLFGFLLLVPLLHTLHFQSLRVSIQGAQSASKVHLGPSGSLSLQKGAELGSPGGTAPAPPC